MKIEKEWDRLKEVMVHTPGTEIDYAMLAPKPFLFERPFNTQRAREEHKKLISLLRENGVKVHVLRDLVVSTADSNAEFRKRLEDEVIATVKFYGNMERVQESVEEFRRNIHYLDSSTLFNTLTLDPSVDLKEDEQNNLAYPRIYSNVPLANLYFMRDQQAVAGNGVFIGNMKRNQRKGETGITEFVFRKLFRAHNMKVVSPDSIFEGGDFMPAGEFSLIGVGTRTNLEGAMEMIKSGMISSDEIGIVSNPIYDFMDGDEKRDPMVNMHLDTYFNIAGDGITVGSEELMKKAKLSLYSKEGDLVEQNLTLHGFLKRKGFSNINLGVSEQMSYSSNFLTLKDRQIVNVNVDQVLKRLLAGNVFHGSLLDAVKKDLNSIGSGNLFPHSSEVRKFGLENIEINLSELTGGYGGAHCMTAALVR